MKDKKGLGYEVFKDRHTVNYISGLKSSSIGIKYIASSLTGYEWFLHTITSADVSKSK